MQNRLPRRVGVASSLAIAALLLSACGGQSEPSSDGTPAADGAATGSVAADGSSTVAPLSSAAADLFRDAEPDINVTVATSGTGGGFAAFCAGETDISNASRPIADDEVAICEENGIDFSEIVMANDGLSVVVNPENDWAECLTVEQLATIWAPESEGEITSWNQVDPSFPDEELVLYGAGTDSGTFDYFTEAINGEEGAIRTDYSPSEDDNVTVQGVQGAAGAMGFFGLSYAEENPDAVNIVQVDNGDGCVTPSAETVQDETYAPLGRPLFVYVANASYAEKPQVATFIDFYVENASKIAEAALFIGLTEEQQATAQEQLAAIGS